MEVLATFDDFSQGNYGDDPQRGNGWFGGENFIPVNGGRTMKIREATTLLSNTGMANTASIFMVPATGGVIAATGTPCWFVSGGGGAPSSLTAFTASPLAASYDWCLYRDGVLVVINADRTYRINSAGLTALASSPSGLCVATLGDRIYIGGISGNANRIQWSDAASETSWGGSNFLDLGLTTNDQVTGLKRQRDSLVAVVGNGSIHKEWYRLSGTPGFDQSSRPINPRGPGLAFSSNALIEGANSRIWFTPRFLATSGGYYGYIDADVPNVSAFPRPNNSTMSGANNGNYKVATLINTPAVFLSDMNSAGSPTVTQRNLLHYEGIWSQHTFSFTGTSSTSAFAVCGGEDLFYIGHGGSAGTKQQFYSWKFNTALDTAPAATDGGGGAVTGIIELPLWFHPANGDVQVQAVTVDYRHYSSATTLACAVDVHGIRDSTFSAVGAAGSGQTFTVSGSPATVGQRCRVTFYPANPMSGAGFQVRLTGCKAIAIEKVAVLGISPESRV